MVRWSEPLFRMSKGRTLSQNRDSIYTAANGRI